MIHRRKDKEEMKNPIIWSDFPDPDVIRVEDTYYMISTTMHVMPGGVLLRSYDLMHWEIASYIYDRLDSTDGQRLQTENGIYGKGMWAATLRYHDGEFFVIFVCNDTQKTYLYRSRDINGPWKKSFIEGFFHDCSLLFDDDGRKYLAYGNREIHITELNDEMTGPKEGGLDRIALVDGPEYSLGYEGTHIYKLFGKYYMTFIHWPKGGRRQQAFYCADSLDGEFVGKNVLDDDMGYHNSGVAQGAIVDTPDGDWYAILFQDHGAVGRIPVLVPVHWENDFPVFGIDGKIPLEIHVPSTRPDYVYEPLNISDSLAYEPDENGKIVLHHAWQWNHEPKETDYSFTERSGWYRIKTSDIRPNMIKAVNSLTQRTVGPRSSATITVDGTSMKNGDFAGIGVLGSLYCMSALTRESDGYYLVALKANPERPQPWGSPKYIDNLPGVVTEKIKIEDPIVNLRIFCDFEDNTDLATAWYEKDGQWIQFGEAVKMQFSLDHFMGYRFSVSMFSTEECGGHADFKNFVFDAPDENN